MKWTSSVFALALAGALTAACGGEDVEGFGGYGGGMPGSGLPEGGEVLLEKVTIVPEITGAPGPVTLNWFYGFQYGGSFMGATSAPPPGTCFEFDHPTSFPVHDIGSGAEYVDWGGEITLTGPDWSKDVPKMVADGETPLVDNRPSPTRQHEEGNWIYGGHGWDLENLQDVEISEGEYSINVQNSEGEDLTWNFPDDNWEKPFDIGNANVEITAGEDLVATWEAIPNPDEPHGRMHSFVFIALAQLPAEGDFGPTPLYLCQPPDTEDGTMTIPADVIDSIPDVGIIQSGRLTHYMDKMTDTGEDRRFDMFSINCGISLYMKVE